MTLPAPAPIRELDVDGIGQRLPKPSSQGEESESPLASAVQSSRDSDEREMEEVDGDGSSDLPTTGEGRSELGPRWVPRASTKQTESSDGRPMPSSSTYPRSSDYYSSGRSTEFSSSASEVCLFSFGIGTSNQSGSYLSEVLLIVVTGVPQQASLHDAYMQMCLKPTC